MFGRIDHVGVAVSDLDAAVTLYEDTFGMPVAHRETVDSQGVEAVLLDVGDGHVELLRPLGPETAVGRFLDKRGEGLHHVAYAVDDIDSTLEQLRSAGVELIDSEARVGIRGSRVAFLHPNATGRVLTEIVEPAEH
jgi:methylmalonyl-CoA/ethylmalonyl-CoA epimerase